MVNVIVAKEKHDCSHLIGQFLDESHYDVLIETDTDCYMPVGCDLTETASNGCDENSDCSTCTIKNGKDERKVAFKFRKNYFTKAEQDAAYEGLKQAASSSQNRGLAAGPRLDKLNDRDWVTEYQLAVLDALTDPRDNLFNESPIERIQQEFATKPADSNRGTVWLSEKVKEKNFNFDKWAEAMKSVSPEVAKKEAMEVEKMISSTTYANAVLSGVAGFYDRYPRIPYGRATAYTENNPELFKKSFPFLQRLNAGFKKLMPWRYNNQYEASKKIDPDFLVPGTVFTTVTVNNTFRTAAHFDAGDLNTGLSNLLVLSNDGRFTGGYLIFPEYRVAVNVRPGDLLLVNNHEVMHGNTPIVCQEGSERISLVCYFREGMLELGPMEYENYRREFVEFNAKNEADPRWKPRYNGVFAGMWDSQEWKEFLLMKPNGQAYLEKYHPSLCTVNLEDMF